MTRLNDEQFHEQTLREGGASRHATTGEVPESGYMVGSSNGFPEQTHPVDQFSVEHVRHHARAIRDHFGPAPVYQGSWKHNGAVILDASERIEDQSTAVQEGKVRGEKAIYDLSRHKDIPTSKY